MLVVAAVCASLVFGGVVVPSYANPAASAQQKASSAQSKVSASEAEVQRTVGELSAARARLARIDADLQKTSDRLDSLIAKQQRLQKHLATRVDGMYRTGRVGFVELLAGASSFEEFTTKWDFLARIGREDAAAVADVKRTRAEAKVSAKQLMQQQVAAAKELESIEAQKAKAQSDLASNRAMLVSYKRQVAAIDAKNEQARKARAAAEKAAAASASPSGGSSSAPSQSGGSGSWNSALCSMYGPGQIGEPLAGGGHLTADAMIVAHKTLPFGTLVEFKYNGRRCVAEVRDRGPYTGGRQFDLGLAPARILGFDGVGRVQYRIVD